MLPRALRMTMNDFKGIKTRLLYRGAFFDVSTSPGTTTKFACVIAKKRIKRAVDRNRARRKVYSNLKVNTPSVPVLVFIYPTKNILQASQDSILEEINKAFATLY